MANQKRIGRQTPTQSVIIPYQKTLSNEAVAYYERSGLSCYEWQKNLLDPIMAVDDDGLWVHQKFGYAIPRRNGKNEVIYMKEIQALEQGLNVLHTAHLISTSHLSFEKVKRYLEKSGYKNGDDFNSIKAKGQERIELFKSGGVIQFRTRTSSGGLGEGFDLMIIDEAQEYTTDYRDDVLTELRLFYDMSGGYFQKGLVQKITAEKQRIKNSFLDETMADNNKKHQKSTFQ